MEQDLLFPLVTFPTLSSGRLRLREMGAADAESIFGIRGDYEVTRLNIGPAYVSVDEARDLIARMAESYARGREIRWGITLNEQKGAAPVVGMVGFNYWHRQDRRASLGFDLARSYWGQGIMREALGVVLRFGFTELGLNRAEADTSAENDRSIRLLESLGFVREGCQREQYFDEGAFHDLYQYGLLRREWEAAGPSRRLPKDYTSDSR